MISRLISWIRKLREGNVGELIARGCIYADNYYADQVCLDELVSPKHASRTRQ